MYDESNWVYILDYFAPAVQLGLTATLMLGIRSHPRLFRRARLCGCGTGSNGQLYAFNRCERGHKNCDSANGLSPEELRAVEDGAIRDAVRMQEEVGLRSATDGEFRRASWHMDFIYCLGGVRPGRRHDPRAVPERGRRARLRPRPRCAVDGPVRLQETIFADDFTFLPQTVTTAVSRS